jgi:hypothetical protein
MTGASGTIMGSYFNGLDSKKGRPGGVGIRKSKLVANRLCAASWQSHGAHGYFIVFAARMKIGWIWTVGLDGWVEYRDAIRCGGMTVPGLNAEILRRPSGGSG